MLREYEDEDGNIVLYFDDVPPNVRTKKHKIELDPTMRQDFLSCGRMGYQKATQPTYERNATVRQAYQIERKALRKWIESGAITPTVAMELKEHGDKWNIHHFFPIVLGGTNEPANLYLMPIELHDRLHHFFLDCVLKLCQRPYYLRLHDMGRLYLELPTPRNHILDEKNIPFCHQHHVGDVLSRYRYLDTKPISSGSISGLRPVTPPCHIKKEDWNVFSLFKMALTAIRWQRADILKALLDKTALFSQQSGCVLSPDSCHPKTGQSLLMEACICCNGPAVDVLLRRGAHPNWRDKQGRTALHKITSTKSMGFVHMLLKAGADVHAEDKRGRTPLWFIGRYYVKQKLEALLKLGLDINHQDKSGNTVLFYALQTKQWYLIELLLRKGIDITLKNQQGRTIIDEGCQSTDETVKKIFHHCQETNMTDNHVLAQFIYHVRQIETKMCVQHHRTSKLKSQKEEREHA